MKYQPPQPQSYPATTAALITQLKDRIQRLEAVTNDPHALWANWLRGDVKLPEGIGDVREYQDRIQRLEEQLMDTKNKHAVLVADVVLNEDRAERIKELEVRCKGMENCIENAWGIIANVSGGDWSRQHLEWRQTTLDWRNNSFHPIWTEVATRRAEKAKEAKL